jgi:hypothetical protein
MVDKTMALSPEAAYESRLYLGSICPWDAIFGELAVKS